MKKQENFLILFDNDAGRKFLPTLYKVGFIGIILICAIILLDQSVANNFTMWSLVIIITLFWLFFGSYINRSAYKIVISRSSEEIQFFMLKNDKILTIKIDEIDEVSINFYITFHCGRNVVICNEARNLELIDNLKEFFSIKYGLFGKLFLKLGFR